MPRQLQPCGTNAAYARHIKAHEDVDSACRAAHNAYNAALAAGTLPGPPEPPPCGSVEAYDRHRYRSEPIDDLCRKAHSAYMREYRAKRRRAKAERAAVLNAAWAEVLAEAGVA